MYTGARPDGDHLQRRPTESGNRVASRLTGKRPEGDFRVGHRRPSSTPPCLAPGRRRHMPRPDKTNQMTGETTMTLSRRGFTFGTAGALAAGGLARLARA